MFKRLQFSLQIGCILFGSIIFLVPMPSFAQGISLTDEQLRDTQIQKQTSQLIFGMLKTTDKEETKPSEKTETANLILQTLKKNNAHIIKENLSNQKQDRFIQKSIKDSIIHNIQQQDQLDIDDSKTLPGISSIKDDNPLLDTLNSSNKPTDISLVKKYGGFKGYQQALLNEVLDDSSITSSLDKSLAQLQIEELTKQYGSLNSQYRILLSAKDGTDETYRELVLAMKLTQRSIKETLDSINKRIIKIKLFEERLRDSKLQLGITLPNLIEAEEELIRYTQTFYKMNHDLFDQDKNHKKVSDLKLFTKSDNIAETLASDIMVKDLTVKLDELLSTISDLRRGFSLVYKSYERTHDTLTNELSTYHQEKETLNQQIQNYGEFMLYVKSNKAYIDDKKTVLEKEKRNLGKEQEIVQLLNKATTQEQLDLIKERLSEIVDDESTFFDFPIPTVSKITSFFEDEGYNRLFGVDHHYALDFRLAQGSVIYAPADGYVYKVIDQNSSMLNRLIVLHQNNFATVYLHMQDTFVQEGEFLNRGDMIGLSGGTPGTRGAGHMTTGPHLHREVRKDARVVDPLLFTDLSLIGDKSMLQARHGEKWEREHGYAH